MFNSSTYTQGLGSLIGNRFCHQRDVDVGCGRSGSSTVFWIYTIHYGSQDLDLLAVSALCFKLTLLHRAWSVPISGGRTQNHGRYYLEVKVWGTSCFVVVWKSKSAVGVFTTTKCLPCSCMTRFLRKNKRREGTSSNAYWSGLQPLKVSRQSK